MGDTAGSQHVRGGGEMQGWERARHDAREQVPRHDEKVEKCTQKSRCKSPFWGGGEDKGLRKNWALDLALPGNL